MLPDLEFLHIDYNNLTTLDMSQNPKLQGNGFVAANNQLDELTLPNLPGMSIEASVFHEQNPRTGYDTVRWFYDSSYSQEIAEGDRVEANGRKIYAKWIANPYTVYYNANGGRGSIPPQAVEYDQTFRLSPNTFTRTGYTFLNWNTYPDAAGGRTFTDGQEVVNLTGASSNRDRVTLHAQWSANTYTIRYDANGGQGRVDDTPAVYDQPAVLAENQFTKQDAVFSGWSLTVGESNPKDYAPGDSVRNLTAENQGVVTLYAVWRSHAEIQQQYQDQLTDFFRAFQTGNYYPEDWASLQSIRRVVSETVAQSGGDESAMQTALEAAYEEARNVSTKEQRAQAVAQSWRTAHSGILSQISVPVALDRLEETSLLAQAAVADAGTEWLAQQSTLTDPASRQDAARAAQNKLATEVQQLQSMQHAIVWLGSVKDAYQVPLSSVTSADAAQYAASVNAYAALSSQEKAYCTPGVADQLTVRRNLAQEKQIAIRNLDTYFASLNLTDYTEANQKKLEQIAAETKTAIESADTAGAADRLFLEGVDRFKEVETIVRQKTPVIEVKPTASAITKGQKLSDSQLIGGKADAEGTFAWKDSSVAPPQTGAHPVVFTPKDGTAYRTIEFYISVTVNEPVPEVPSSSGTPAAPAPGSSPAQPSSPAPGGTASSSAPVSSKPQSGSSSASVSQPGSSSSASAAESGTAAESGSVSSSGSSSDAQEPAVPKTPAGLILAVVAAVGAAAAAVFLIVSKKRK